MAFVASITYEALLDPSTFLLHDSSIYASPDSKANISSRTVTILDANGAALSGYTNPIPFPYGGGDTLSITGLTQDYALQIIMTLTPISPQSGSIYTAEADVATQRFLQEGLYNIQVQRLNTLQPSSLSDQVYRRNSIDIIIEGSTSQTAMFYANYTGSQDALNRAQNIINNTTL